MCAHTFVQNGVEITKVFIKHCAHKKESSSMSLHDTTHDDTYTVPIYRKGSNT